LLDQLLLTLRENVSDINLNHIYTKYNLNLIN